MTTRRAAAVKKKVMEKPAGSMVILDDAGFEKAWLVMPHDFRMGDLRKWGDAEVAGDLLTVYGYLARVVVAWDGFATDKSPSDPESYDELTVPQYRRLATAVGTWIQNNSGGKG